MHILIEDGYTLGSSRLGAEVKTCTDTLTETDVGIEHRRVRVIDEEATIDIDRGVFVIVETGSKIDRTAVVVLLHLLERRTLLLVADVGKAVFADTDTVHGFLQIEAVA